MKKLATIFGLSTVAAISLAVVNSGLNVGEKVSPFHPMHVSGALAGEKKCFPCTYKAAPQVQVWVNGDSMENVAGIAKMLDKQMGKNDKFKAMVVLLSNDEKKATETLKAAAKMPGLKNISMAWMKPTDEAVKAYKFNLEAKNTVFVYKNWEVTGKFVNLKSDEKGLSALGSAVKGIL
jgi:nitrate reductase NapAB chaperone NapD